MESDRQTPILKGGSCRSFVHVDQKESVFLELRRRRTR